MSEYLHGAYGDSQANGNRVAASSPSAIIAIGTAPVQTVAGGAENVNVPKIVYNIAEARKLFGYSDDWADYTLCEAMHHFFETAGVGPLVLINVLDPAKHALSPVTTENKTPSSGVITLTGAALIETDSIAVGTKTEGTDYTVAVNGDNVVITEKTEGALGSAELAVSYRKKTGRFTLLPAHFCCCQQIPITVYIPREPLWSGSASISVQSPWTELPALLLRCS